MNTEFETALEKGKAIGLSKQEKSDMKASLLSYAKNHPVRSVAPLPWHTYFKSHIALTAFTILVIMTGGGSVFAEKSFPGDVLYGVKTGVNEQVRGLFAVSSESKALWQLNLADRRLQEVEYVALTQSDAEETKNALIAQVDLHIKSATLQSEQEEKLSSEDTQSNDNSNTKTETLKKSAVAEKEPVQATFMATMAVSDEPTPILTVDVIEVFPLPTNTVDTDVDMSFERVQSAQENVRQIIQRKESKKVRLQAELEFVKARREFFELKDRENKKTVADISLIIEDESRKFETLDDTVIETGDSE